MDSCHIFNFLFGTRKTTSELRKCFSAASGSNGAAEGGRKKRAAHEGPPASPLRQIHSKLVSFANLATSTKLATRTDGPQPNNLERHRSKRPSGVAKAERPQSGTYKATLIELPLDEELESASGFELVKSYELVDANNNNYHRNQEAANEEATISNQCSSRTVLYDNPAAAAPGERAESAQPDERKCDETPSGGLEQEDKSSSVRTSERVRHLVRSFESFDEHPPKESPSRDVTPAATAAALQEAARSPGRNGALRLRWPPEGGANSLDAAATNTNEEEADSTDSERAAGRRPKPTTIVKPLPPKTPPKSKRAKCLTMQLSLKKPQQIEQLFQDDHFLERHFFAQLRPLDRCSAAQVCRKWRKLLYARPEYWKELVGVIDCTQLRREHLIQCIVSTLQTAKQKHQQQAALAHQPHSLQSHHQNHHSQISHSHHQQQQQQHQVGSGGPNGLQRAPLDAAAQEALECLDQEEIWRIQELCNRYARGSLASSGQFASRSLLSNAAAAAAANSNHLEEPQVVVVNGERLLANSKSQSSIRSQMSSTVSSVSLSSLLSPLSESSRVDSIREKLYGALEERGFDALCLFGASDDDIEELVSKTRPQGAQRRVLVGRLHNCPLSDKGLELFLSTFNQMEELELSGCNEITNAIELKPLAELKRLIITDCINMADGLAQRLVEVFQQLEELVIQAYHLTDAFLEYISLNQDTGRLVRLELPNCKEISNASMLTIAKHFPNVRALSISGSTKISDDGIEILTEHAKQLRSLDLSWCTKITDVSLECLACDLSGSLCELVLDRNAHITDIGLGYLATMSRLELLYIRWCARVTDLGVESLLTMRSLRRLSLAGLHQLTARSLLCLIEASHSQQLEEVELTNCPAVNGDLMQFLRAKMPKCNIIF